MNVDDQDLDLESTPTHEHRAVRATPADMALVSRLVAGDEASFVSFLRQHHATMVRVALTMVGSRAVAEEVAQETWQAVIQGLPRFEGRSSLKTWLFHILAKRARTRGLRERRQVPFSTLGVPDDLDDSVPRGSRSDRWPVPPLRFDGESPERLMLRREVASALEAAIESLPPALQTVLTLRDIGGCSGAEVCNALNVNETNQRVMLHRARTKVRVFLDSFFESRK